MNVRSSLGHMPRAKLWSMKKSSLPLEPSVEQKPSISCVSERDERRRVLNSIALLYENYTALLYNYQWNAETRFIHSLLRHRSALVTGEYLLKTEIFLCVKNNSVSGGVSGQTG